MLLTWSESIIFYIVGMLLVCLGVVYSAVVIPLKGICIHTDRCIGSTTNIFLFFFLMIKTLRRKIGSKYRVFISLKRKTFYLILCRFCFRRIHKWSKKKCFIDDLKWLFGMCRDTTHCYSSSSNKMVIFWRKKKDEEEILGAISTVNIDTDINQNIYLDTQ